jgi:hypothetical protein
MNTLAEKAQPWAETSMTLVGPMLSQATQS